MNAGRRLVAGGAIAALAGTIVTAGGAFAETTALPPAAAVSPDRTSAAGSRKVDAVPTPRLAWSACFEIAECATVKLPLDYDQPRGATTEVAVLRVKAKEQANRIGSLFINPGDHELLRRAVGDPVRNFETITRKLKAKPLVIEVRTITYADFIRDVQSGMTLPTAGEVVTTFAAEVWAALDGDTAALLRRLQAAAATVPGDDAPYDNSVDGIVGVMCADGRFPARAAQWPAAVAAWEKAAPHFGGSAVAWKDSTCASSTWTVRDEDAYTGPFDRRTAAPVLVVGSFWDPASELAVPIPDQESPRTPGQHAHPSTSTRSPVGTTDNQQVKHRIL